MDRVIDDHWIASLAFVDGTSPCGQDHITGGVWSAASCDSEIPPCEDLGDGFYIVQRAA